MSTRIGRYVRHCLTSSEELMEAIGGRIIDIVDTMDGEVALPYVTQWSGGFDEEETKDGIYGDTVRVEMDVAASSQDELGEVAHLIRQAMASGMESWNEQDNQIFSIFDQTLRVGEESFDIQSDAFVLPMTYTIVIEF